MGRPRVAHTPFSPEHRGAAQSWWPHRPTPLGIWPDHRISYPGPPPPPGPSMFTKPFDYVNSVFREKQFLLLLFFVFQFFAFIYVFSLLFFPFFPFSFLFINIPTKMGPRSPKKVIPTKMGRPRVAHTPFSPEHRGGGTITTTPTNPSRDLAGSPDFLPWAAAAAWPLYCLQNPSTT